MQFRRCQYSSGRNIIKYLQWYNVGVWIIQYGFLYDLIRSQDERLRKLSVVQHRLKIIMITVNFLCALSPRVGNRGTEKNLVNIVSIVEKSGGKRLGRCSATLMVGYLCCKSYYMCALSICIFAFYVHPHIQYERAAVRCDTLHCCRFFLPFVISHRLSSNVIRLFYWTSHCTISHSVSMLRESKCRFWFWRTTEKTRR